MNSKDIHLSKSLSWLLRHGAVKEGLTLSSEGYINVDKVLQHKSFKQYSRGDIERVVKNNDKQRFALRLNPTSRSLEIKANQGHSIEKITDAELTPILTAKYNTVVHGTYNKRWPQIKQNGLSRMRRLHIHLAKGTPTDRTVISGLRASAQIHIYVNVERALADGIKFYESDNGVILTPGNDKGFLETKYFDRVVEVLTELRMEAIPPVAPPMRAYGRPPFPQVPPRPHAKPARAYLPAARPAAPPPFAARPAPLPPPAPRTAPPSRGPPGPAAPGPRSAGAQRDFRPRPKPEPDRLLPTSILVTGYPPYTKAQDLAHVFCRFGDVRLNYDWITDAGACLEFGTAEQARAAIAASRAVSVYGAVLSVRPCSLHTRPQRQPRRRDHRVRQAPKGVTVEPSSIPLEGTFQQQLEALLSCVQLSPAELARLGALYADIEAALRDTWPGCRAYPFGSVTTGLGVKSSDADCFVALPPGAAPGAVPRARRALQQHPRLFADLLAIPRANTPIVKFLHVPTGVYCDLSFKTSLGSRNSELIAFLLHSDPRLIPVAVVIKYWARVHELTGTGKLTNYALTLLVVFYLQARRLLPAVERLQREPADAHFVDGWNTGFCTEPLPRGADPASVADLLGGFFEFYAEFDFDRLVVCPLTGRGVDKDAFRDPEPLPPEFAPYKANVAGGRAPPLRFMSPLCVQDPFELCHNVASPVTPRLAADIRAFLKFGAEAYARGRPGCAALLPRLLLARPELPRPRPKCRFRVRVPPALLRDVAAKDWKTAVRDVALHIFEKLLRTKLEIQEDELPQEKPAGAGRKEAKGKSDAAAGRGAAEAGENGTAAPGDREGSAGATEGGKPEAEGKDAAGAEEESERPDDEEATGEKDKSPTKLEAKRTALLQGKVKGEKAAPKTVGEAPARPPPGVSMKEKERYTAEATRAIWKRKRFLNNSIGGLLFPERETVITDEILKLDTVAINVRFQVTLTFNNAPRGALLDLKYVSGKLESFKEFGYFISATFNNWFVSLFNPYCKKNASKKGLPDISAINFREGTDSDSDTDSYEDERINPDANPDSKEKKTDKTESQNDSVDRSVLEKSIKNKTNNSVKEQSESDKNKSNTNKTQPDKNETLAHENDKDENPSDKSPQKKTKNRSPRHRKSKDVSHNSTGDADSPKIPNTVANGPMP